MSLLGKLVCKLRGHPRGKRVSAVGPSITLKCPRCAATWTRKHRKQKATA